MDPGDDLEDLVDDDTAVREVLRDMLAALGHRVAEFRSGEEALRGYEPGLYDLLLTDLGMPGVTGWKLAASVREVDRTVAIGFVTGWGHEVRPETLRNASVDLLMSKPFTLEDVMAVTQQACARLARSGEGPEAGRAAA